MDDAKAWDIPFVSLMENSDMEKEKQPQMR